MVPETTSRSIAKFRLYAALRPSAVKEAQSPGSTREVSCIHCEKHDCHVLDSRQIGINGEQASDMPA